MSNEIIYFSNLPIVDPRAAPVKPTTNDTSLTVQDIAVTNARIPATRKKLFLSEPNSTLARLDINPIIASRAPQTTSGYPKRIEKLVRKRKKGKNVYRVDNRERLSLEDQNYLLIVIENKEIKYKRFEKKP